MNSEERFNRTMRLIAVAIAVLYLARYLRTWAEADTWTLLDDIDLAIHEAGHLVFSPFGEFMTVLGGSLFQVLVPAIFAGYFARRREWFSSLFVLYWVGQSCFNVSYYIADARVRELPLITGDPTTHDWTWLLLQTNLLQQDTAIGNAVRIFGLLLFTVATAGCIRIATYQPPAPPRSFASTTPIVDRAAMQ